MSHQLSIMMGESTYPCDNHERIVSAKNAEDFDASIKSKTDDDSTEQECGHNDSNYRSTLICRHYDFPEINLTQVE